MNDDDNQCLNVEIAYNQNHNFKQSILSIINFTDYHNNYARRFF